MERACDAGKLQPSDEMRLSVDPMWQTRSNMACTRHSTQLIVFEPSGNITEFSCK